MTDTETEAISSDSVRPIDLSVIVTIVSGGSHLEACLRSLRDQSDCAADRLEIIIPYDRDDASIARLAPLYPEMQFLGIPLSVKAPPGSCHEHFDQYRAAGLNQARGRVVALLEDHENPAEDWCESVLVAHRLPYAAIGGAVENAIDRPVNWATYFFDFGRYQNPVENGPSPWLTDVNVSYKREAIDAIRDVWSSGFHEPAVHAALRASGRTLWLSPEIVVYQCRTGLGLSGALRERYVWGRYFAAKRFPQVHGKRRILYAAATWIVPAIILAKMSKNAWSKKRLAAKFVRALPLILLMTVFWSAGELAGYLSGRPR